MISKSRTFYINSNKRTEGSASHSDFHVKIEVPSNPKFDRVVLLKASIPRSTYLVQENHNTFTLKEGSTEYTITLPVGNYSKTSLKNVLPDLLNTAGSYTYAMTYPSNTSASDTGKFTFTSTGSDSAFVFTTFVYELLGFNKNTTNSFSSGTLISTNVIKFQLEDVLYLHSNLVGGENNDILAPIYVSSSPYLSNVSYTCPDVMAYSKTLASQSSNSYYFSVTDEEDVVQSTNGLNINLTIMFFSLDNVFTMIKRAIQLNSLRIDAELRERQELKALQENENLDEKQGPPI